MRLIGRRSEDCYLAEVEARPDGKRMARVLDLEQGIFFAPWPLHSILARGYWKEYEGTEAELATLLERVKP